MSAVLRCSVEPLTDLSVVSALCRDPYIARVGHDHRPADAIAHPDVRYLAARVDGQLVGAFCVIDSGWVECDLHAMLRREAIGASRELGRLCLLWAFARAHVARVTAQILEGLESAANYCRRLGFAYEGFRPDAVQKDGRLVGVHMLGLTRAQWIGGVQ